VAKYLTGNKPEPVKESMTGHRKALEAALDMIARTFADYAQACIETGASGIFFATTGWASKDDLGEDEYRTFGIPYDLRVLEAVAGKGPVNILHNCGDNIYFDLLEDYPVAAISWAATLPGNPTLAEGQRSTKKAVMGGVSEKTILPEGSPEQVAEEVSRAVAQTGGRHVLIAPGCSIPPRTPRINREAAAIAARRRFGIAG
jgi:uroporphyrinogen decarboxylase